LNEVQGRFYRLGAEIARLEQAIQHARELRSRQKNDLEEVRVSIQELHEHIERDEIQIHDLGRTLGELGPGLEAARAAEEASADALRSAETDMENWQARWDQFKEEAGEASRTSDVEKARIEQIEGQMRRLVERRERCAREIARLSGMHEGTDIAKLEADTRGAEKQASDLDSEFQSVREDIEQSRRQEKEGAAKIDDLRGRLQRAAGELASLEALQEAALGRKDGAIKEWLEGRGLSDHPRLAERLTVADGWELATETVLGGYLEAVCVDGLDDAAAALDSLSHGTLSLLESTGAPRQQAAMEGTALLDKVEGPIGLERLLSGVRTADTLSTALEMRSALGPGESVVTPEGIWVGDGWLRVYRGTDDKSGLIQRENEIRERREAVEALKAQVTGLEKEQAAVEEVLSTLERRRDSLQEQINESHRRYGDVRGQLSSARDRVEQTRIQIAQLTAEAAEVDAHLQESDDQLRGSRRKLEGSIGQMTVFEARREELAEQRQALQEVLEQARERSRVDRATAHHIAIKVESRKSTRDSAQVALERLKAQLAQHTRRAEELTGQLGGGEAPIEEKQTELEACLAQRVELDAELSAARDKVQATEITLRKMQEQRQIREREAQDVRATLDELRLAAREIQVRRQTVSEQFGETGFEIESLRGEMDEAASIPDWEVQVEKLTARIQRLGAINLASIDELKEQCERKEYLDSQFEDLTEALNTLENAIRKIDRETRNRFKETFDRVNAGMKEIFPRLFGGGHAYLELLGDDLLDAGVTVMARPPGKRISTIHLLSGGEKALSAVALVFAIFHLNPAPFCMLDEVDAPLDDANVGRFCEIVREMAERVQFIVITHNKVTMEMTHQLAGVTMSEPGVSRLVAVDLDEAVQMAAM
jgi:chromosome segregation protein